MAQASGGASTAGTAGAASGGGKEGAAPASAAAPANEGAAPLVSLTGEEIPTGESNAAGKKDEGDGKKPGDEEQAPKKDEKAPVVPEAYKLKLPDDIKVHPELMGKFTEFAKGKQLTNEDAQKLADLHLESIGIFAQQQADAQLAEATEWSNEIANDKEIGGAKLEATMKQARKIMEVAKTIPGVNVDRLNKALNKSYMATQPDLVRIMHFLGQFVGEDHKIIMGQPGVTAGQKSAAQALYGKD